MNNDRLAGLENKSVTGDVHHYSRFVRLIKIAMPLGVIAILGLLFIYPQISHIDTVPLSQDDLQALKSAETENTLKNPVYNTLDSKGNPFSITAQAATQNRDNSDLVLLDSPTAKLNDGNNIYNMRAGTGEYDQAQKTLILDGNVVIQDDNQIRLETDRLVSLIELGRAYSETPAVLTAREGVIEGESVHLDHHNQMTVFKGPAKAVIVKE